MGITVIPGGVGMSQLQAKMMLDYLGDPESFRRGEFGRLADVPVAAQRKESRL